ncbi:MAG: hypothetical protein AB1546_07720, partial [bacterium]
EKKEEVKETKTEEKPPEKTEQKEKPPEKPAEAAAPQSPARQLPGIWFRVHLGVISPRKGYIDHGLNQELKRDPTFVWGFDRVLLDTRRQVVVTRFLYSEPPLDSGAAAQLNGDSHYFQIALNYIVARNGDLYRRSYQYFGYGIAYSRIGVSARCLDPSGCGSVPEGVISSTSKDTIEPNLILGYHTDSSFDYELQYTTKRKDLFVTIAYPLK